MGSGCHAIVFFFVCVVSSRTHIDNLHNSRMLWSFSLLWNPPNDDLLSDAPLRFRVPVYSLLSVVGSVKFSLPRKSRRFAKMALYKFKEIQVPSRESTLALSYRGLLWFDGIYHKVYWHKVAQLIHIFIILSRHFSSKN